MQTNIDYLRVISLLIRSQRVDHVFVLLRVQEILKFDHQYLSAEIFFLYNHICSTLKEGKIIIWKTGATDSKDI